MAFGIRVRNQIQKKIGKDKWEDEWIYFVRYAESVYFGKIENAARMTEEEAGKMQQRLDMFNPKPCHYVVKLPDSKADEPPKAFDFD